MAINGIQMQAGLSLVEFVAAYGTQAQCEAALAKARWPGGFVCPRCGSQRCSRFRRGDTPYRQCTACRHQCSLRSGTMMQGSPLPLTT